MMQPICDTPLFDENQDEFGRIPLTELISNSIITLAKEKHPCTVYGIYGAWGEGKTSMMNFIEKRLVDNKDNDKIVIVKFNPWQVGSDELLMGEFFKCICKDFEGDIRYFIKKYGDVLSFAAKAIPVVGQTLSSGIKTAKEALASSENTLKEQKDRISKAITDSGKHLLVFIDDLDRLDKEELHTVFRLIRQVADFDNTIYVVAMDVDMASRSIGPYFGEGSKEDGRRFIDKIVQVPIALPVIQNTFLIKFLRQSLQLLFEQYIPYELCHVDNIAKDVAGLFGTKRDCIRYLNQLKFVVPAVCDEVNVYDLCLLEAIKVISQEAYMKILHHKNALLKKPEKMERALKKDEELKKLLDDRFDQALREITDGLKKRNVGESVENLLRYNLFDSNNYRSSVIDYQTLLDKQRLQSEVYFDKYFVLAVPEQLIPDKVIKSLSEKLPSMNHFELSQWIDETYAQYSYEEIQRVALKVIRTPVSGRSEATEKFCEALSISELAKGYSTTLFNEKRCEIFITATLLPNYMLSSSESTNSYSWRLDVARVDKTLAVIFSEAELNFSIQVLYGVVKLMGVKAKDIASSFIILKDRFVALSINEQIEYDGELLMVFYWAWNQIDAQAKFDYLANQIENTDFPCEQFVEQIVQYREDATDISSFLDVFRDVMPLIEEKVKTTGVNVDANSSLGLLLSNYKYDLID